MPITYPVTVAIMSAAAAPVVASQIDTIASPPRLAGGMTVYKDDDYPKEALRLRQSGTTRVALRINRNGRVSECRILESSGSDSLDTATCSTMRNWKFTPALTAEGKAVDGDFVRSMKWTLPRT